MLDQLIQNAAQLMSEQADAYRRLDAACLQLCGALAGGKPENIEAFTRAGEAELLTMRSRLVELMAALSTFSDRRGEQDTQTLLTEKTRLQFREASSALVNAAKGFEKTRARAAAVARHGATFASTSLEICGIPPTTYRAPYARRGEVRGWA